MLIPPDAGKRKGARPGWDGGLYASMGRVLASERGGGLYARRQGMIEPVFAHTRFNRRMDRFQRRGRSAARSEWRLMTATHNLVKALHAHQRAGGGLSRRSAVPSHQQTGVPAGTPATFRNRDKRSAPALPVPRLEGTRPDAHSAWMTAFARSRSEMSSCGGQKTTNSRTPAAANRFTVSASRSRPPPRSVARHGSSAA